MRSKILIGIAILVVLAVAGGSWYFTQPGRSNEAFLGHGYSQDDDILITSPAYDSKLSASQKTTVQWEISPSTLDSFPADFDLSVLLYAQNVDEKGVTYPIGDGHPVATEIETWAKGSSIWDIPGYISQGQLKPGRYIIVAQLQAMPKDHARMCAESIGKDCSPNAADKAVILRASQIKGVSGLFSISVSIPK